jgi:hypothetical protein
MGIVRKSFLLNRLGIPISKSEGRNVVANMRELIIFRNKDHGGIWLSCSTQLSNDSLRNW